MHICQKSTRDIIKKSYWNHITSYQNVIAEKKMESECPMEGNCLMTQFINVT